MSLGMASIISPVGVNTKIIQHLENGLIADSAAEWEMSLRKLLQDEALRKEFGKNARKTIQTSWSIEAWKEAYIQLLQK